MQVCPECLSAEMVEDLETGEVICRSCGYVIEKLSNLDFRLPFGTTYALESPLAVGKSLGGTITRQELQDLGQVWLLVLKTSA